jgi:hypothetical protein
MISRSPIISTFSHKSSSRLYGCAIYTVPHQRFQHSSLCISPFGFLSSGCSKLPQSMLYGRTTQAVPDIGFSLWTLRMLATLPAILAFHAHHGPPILRSHDTRGSRHRFQRSYLRVSAALLTFLRLPPTSRLAGINAFRLHVTRGSRYRFQPSSLSISAARPPSRAFIHANAYLARPMLRRRPDASPSSPDHDLHYQYPTPHP